MNLFEQHRQQVAETESLLLPVCPALEEFIGHHMIGPVVCYVAIQADQLSSIIFYGPPGTGKTTLARIIAIQPALTHRYQCFSPG